MTTSTLPGARSLIMLLIGAAISCSSEGPTDETPAGALKLFLESMERYDRQKAFSLLAPEIQRELERRAQIATKQAGREIEPAKMLVVERFVMKWEIADMETSIDGERATVLVKGREETQRSTIECLHTDDGWRVKLPL